MIGLSPRKRAGAAVDLFVVRLVYAFNWYNVGAVLPLIGTSFAAGTAALGVVVGAFLLGVGVFQIPAGFASLRWGARRVSLVGAGTMAVMGIVSAFSQTTVELAVTRFGAGVGAAFFFSPGLSLIASYYPEGQRGPIIGWYNGGFSVGGAIGLVGGAALGLRFGWPLALGFGGVALLAATVASHWILPPEPARVVPKTVRQLWAAGRGTLRSRAIWSLALGLTGFWGAIYVVAQFFVKFAADVHPEWGTSIPPILAFLVVINSLPGGPAGGWIAERGMDQRWVVGGFGLVAGSLVLLIPFVSLWEFVPLFLALAFVDGIVFAALYLIPSYLAESRGEGLALGVAFINSVQVLLGSGISIAFGFVAAADGFTSGWLFAGILTIALLPLLIWVPPNRASRSRADSRGRAKPTAMTAP